jgi:hypothetical protein
VRSKGKESNLLKQERKGEGKRYRIKSQRWFGKPALSKGAGRNIFIFIKRYLFYMGYLGLEPRTYRLKAEYSTIELATL